MASNLTERDQRFLDELVAGGRFQDRNQAIEAAVDCLRQAIDLDDLLEDRYAQVERGDVITYNEESLDARFEELRLRAKAAARQIDAP